MNSLRQDMNLGWKRVESGWLYFILVMFSRALVKHQNLSDVQGRTGTLGPCQGWTTRFMSFQNE